MIRQAAPSQRRRRFSFADRADSGGRREDRLVGAPLVGARRKGIDRAATRAASTDCGAAGVRIAPHPAAAGRPIGSRFDDELYPPVRASLDTHISGPESSGHVWGAGTAFHSLAPREVGPARLRHQTWPKSDISDFGWRGWGEGATKIPYRTPEPPHPTFSPTGRRSERQCAPEHAT
jgi:hypothetical protein